MKHSVLIRQLKKSGIDQDQLDDKMLSFLRVIDAFHFKQDEERKRLSHVIDTMTKENEILFAQVKKQAEIAINESKMMALGEMSASIAHEVNNPLMILQTGLSLIDELMNDPVNNVEMIKDQLREAEATIERISKIVRGLSLFSRDGRQDPLVKYNLAEIISDTLPLCEEKQKKSGVVLLNKIQPDIFVRCRPSQLSQVFLNLIMNARDAIAEREEKWIKLETVTDQDKVYIRVIDSGKGIIESHHGTIRIDNDCKNTCFEIGFLMA